MSEATPAAATTVDVSAPVEASVDTGSSKASVDIDSDPTESFSDFIKRTSKQTKKEESKPKMTALADPAPVIDTLAEGESELETAIESTEESEIPEVDQTTIKVGDKEYKAEDIQKLSKDIEEANLRVKDNESKLEQINKDIETFISKLKSDPDIFRRLEIPIEVIEEYYYKTFVEPTIELTAEQKAQKFDQMKKAEQEQALKEQEDRKRSEEEAKSAEVTNFYKQKWATEIENLINQGDLPKTDFVMQRVAGYIKQALDKQLYHLASADIIGAVKQDVKALNDQMLKSMSPEQLQAALGEEGLKKIRDADLKKFSNSKFQNTNPGTPGDSKIKTSQPKKRVTSPFGLLD